jgi:hypothetical protein
VPTVNLSGDSPNVDDGVLRLRKAISAAHGMVSGPFSLGARVLIQGCTFDAGGYITNA